MPVPKMGFWVATVVATFIAAALLALFCYAPQGDLSAILFDRYYWHVTRFSFYQATLSTLASVIPAIGFAVALSHRQFVAKPLLIKICSSTIALPVLVAIFGLIALYGRSGWLNHALSDFGLNWPFSIYGLSGIVLAHLFFNLPYAAVLFYQRLQSIPSEHDLLALHLGFTPWQRFKLIEWPRIKPQLAQVSGLIFMLCFTSFSIVMALGGGPKSTTIELAIYQALKFDFDLPTGATLALWQILLCGSLAFLLQRIGRGNRLTQESTSQQERQLRDTRGSFAFDVTMLACGVILVVPPFLAVFINGVNSALLTTLSALSFWHALANSLQIAVVASLLALSAALAILASSRMLRLTMKAKQAEWLELSGMVILVTPGIVVSTGLFLLLRNWTDIFGLAYWIVIWVNALMGLPFALKTLQQPMLLVAKQYQYLSLSLGLVGWYRWRIVEWRAIRYPLLHAFVVCFLISMGDLSAIALFGSQEFQTLPLYLYRLMGSYQMEAAASVALFMLLLCMGCFYLIERFSQRKIKEPACYK